MRGVHERDGARGALGRLEFLDRPEHGARGVLAAEDDDPVGDDPEDPGGTVVPPQTICFSERVSNSPAWKRGCPSIAMNMVGTQIAKVARSLAMTSSCLAGSNVI